VSDITDRFVWLLWEPNDNLSEHGTTGWKHTYGYDRAGFVCDVRIGLFTFYS
jgi:hypothetical protein